MKRIKCALFTNFNNECETINMKSFIEPKIKKNFLNHSNYPNTLPLKPFQMET